MRASRHSLRLDLVMANAEPSTQLSPRRAELASFERCYAVAVRNRLASGCIQFIVSTGEALRPFRVRSEEHTSELQSLMRISYAVFCLKKKKTENKTRNHEH